MVIKKYIIIIITPFFFFFPFKVICEEVTSLKSSKPVTEIIFKFKGKEDKGLKEDLLSLVTINIGDDFSEEKILESIKLLESSKLFSEINADIEEKENEIKVIFELTKNKIIKDIKIIGNYPIFKTEVLKVMSIYPGDIYKAEEVLKQKKYIYELYRKEGFIRPSIEIETIIDPKDENVIIIVNIKIENYYYLDDLKFRGNKHFSDNILKSKMKSWYISLITGPLKRFVEEDLKEDIKRLEKYMWEAGYPDAKISYNLRRNMQTGEVDAIIDVYEGDYYTVQFEGVHYFSKRKLKKAVTIFEEGNHHHELEKSKENILTLYRNYGFLEAKVSTEIIPQNGKKVIFKIEEGVQSHIEEIKIEGAYALGKRKVMNQLLTQKRSIFNEGYYSEKVLEDDLLAIRALYARYGFVNMEIIEKKIIFSEDKKKIKIFIKIDEGRQAKVGKIKFEGLSVIEEKYALKQLKLKKGKIFKDYLLEIDANNLASIISELGYPHVKVTYDTTLNEDGSLVDVTFRIDEGIFVTMGKVFYVGNLNTKKSALKKEIPIKEGEPFSLTKMLEIQKDLRDIGHFNSVDFEWIGLQEKEEKVHLIVFVKEKPQYYKEIGGGYETDNGFKGFFTIGDYNLFGYNKEASFHGELGQYGYNSNLSLRDPRLFGFKLLGISTIFIEEKEEPAFSILYYGANFGILKEWFPWLKTNLNISYYRKQTSSLRNVIITTPSIIFDTRDSFIDTHKGIYSSFSVDISKGIKEELDDFIKYSYEIRYFFTPIKKVTIALTGRLGYGITYGKTQDLPIDEQFYLGGTTDVRGYDEDCIRFEYLKDEVIPKGGKVSISGSNEIRFSIPYNFQIPIFYDIGSVTDNFGDISLTTLRSSIGSGLQYKTPVGPIGLLYGIKLDRTRFESLGRLHFSIGYTF